MKPTEDRGARLPESRGVKLPRAERADIGLLLEGTFPYVYGGVSSWVHQIIRAFPELTFAIAFLGSRAEDYGGLKYELPPNVVHLETHFLHEKQPPPVLHARDGDAQAFATIERAHRYFRTPHAHRADIAQVGELLGELSAGGRLSESDQLYSRRGWRFITESYRAFCSDPSFVDYFWTVRTMHAPIWRLTRIADTFIPVRAYHSVSTGYAGFLGTLLRRRSGRPLILSEHGIYTKERKIDLFQAQWIAEHHGAFGGEASDGSYFRQMWIRFFEALGQLCYDAADPIVALFEANRQRQIADGAAAERTRSIPNGIDVARYAPLRARRGQAVPPVLCLIGRVVPIKDIKTFIRAMRVVANRMPQAQGWIVGPEDEDAAYGAECRSLVQGLDLGGQVRFLGFRQMQDILHQVGVVVLSSISEALPLAVLEGFAAGVPAVCTDVGSCRELVYGTERADGADRALGVAGRIVGIADPQALAAAALELLNDSAQWQAASAAAIRRVERFYTQQRMVAAYRDIYQAALAANGD